MIATVPIADVATNFGQTIINALAIAGSAALGYALTMALTWLICRATIHRQPPKQVTKILSGLGAIALGFVAGMLLFRDGGGGGWGLGGGLGIGKGPNPDATTNKTTQTATTTPATPKPPPTPPDPATSSPAVRIRMLGGAKVKENRFYQLESDQSVHDLTGIRKIVEERKKNATEKLPLKEIVIVLDDDSVTRESKAVKDLVNFAKDLQLVPTVQDLTDK